MPTFQCQFKILFLLIIAFTSISGFPHSGQVHPGQKPSWCSLAFSAVECLQGVLHLKKSHGLSWLFARADSITLLMPVCSSCPAIQVVNYQSSIQNCHSHNQDSLEFCKGREVSLLFHRTFWHPVIRLRAAEGIERRYSHCLTGSSDLAVWICLT